MSASIRPISPPQPSSASVTTTTVSSSSPPTTNRSAGEGPSTTAPSSVSSPHLPPLHPHHGAGPGIQGHLHAHPHHHPHPFAHQHQATAHPTNNNHGAPTTTTTSPPSSSSSLPSPTNPSHLPTPSQQSQIAQARTALVASIGNMLDHELQTRASLLHANQAAIERQERDVARALADLRREDDKLLRVLDRGSRQVKELGDVQNWAERMETDFLVLEETMRLVREGGGGRSGSGSGSGSGSWSGSGSGSGSWSGSDRGSDRGSVVGDGEGDVRMQDVGDEDGEILSGGETVDMDKGKGKGKGTERQVDMSSSAAMDVDPTRIPLPLDDQDIIDGAAPPSEHHTTPAQPSSGATNWFRRMVWRK